MASAADTHRLWRLDEPRLVADITAAFTDRTLYMADGHHRYETALGHWRDRQAAGATSDDPAARALMLLVDVDDPGLAVFPTHRLLKTSAAIDGPALSAALGEWFEAEVIPADEDQPASLLARLDALQATSDVHAFGLLSASAGASVLLRARAGVDLRPLMPAGHGAAWFGLDVAVLHEVVLPRAFGLSGDPASTGLVAFTRDASEAAASVARGEYDAAILLNPTRVRQVRDVAAAGDLMPQKSTYFWPKPLSGLVIYPHAGLSRRTPRSR